VTPNAEVHAVVAVIRRGARFLFVRRAPHLPGGDFWSPPSGKIEPGESHQDAVRREMREELGVDAAAERKIAEVTILGGAYRLHYWRTTIVSGEPRVASDEATDLRWSTLDELRALPRTFEDDLRICALEGSTAADAPGESEPGGGPT
jgi:8-oxo-dGTP diphosphatase